MRDGAVLKMKFTSHELRVAESVPQTFKAIPHNEVLKRMLEKIKGINFRELAGIDGDEKLQKKHYIVYVIDEIKNIAKQGGWRLCRNNGQTFVYNGAFWKAIDREELQLFFGEAAAIIGVPKVDAKFYLFRMDLLKQFDATAYLPAPEKADGLTLINFENGTFVVDGNNQSLRPPKPNDFLTYQLPFKYNPTATAPMFKGFLDTVLPDVERQKVLQEYLGYVFVSSKKLKLEKILLLYGSGANGKSVFIEIMSAMLGKDNVSRYSLESITEAKGYSRAQLGAKLLNLSTEISGKMDKGLFKQLASGESVEARHIYGNPFTMENYAKLLFSTNELPKETENTDGFFRRWLIIPFDVTIEESKQDRELANKIIETELSGVFNWVLAGLNRLLLQRRFTECKAAIEQIKTFRQQSDSVLMFLDEENYQTNPIEYITLKDMFFSYRTFCDGSGHRPCSITTFSSRLKSAGYEVIRKSFGNVVYCKKEYTHTFNAAIEDNEAENNLLF